VISSQGACGASSNSWESPVVAAGLSPALSSRAPMPCAWAFLFGRQALVAGMVSTERSPVHTENSRSSDSNHRWFVLILAGLTATLAIAMPAMAMPVLFAEMSDDLGLSLVQIGAIWGAGSLAGLFTDLAGGAIGDRFGTRRTLAIGCLAIGVTGALRGFSTNFATLVSTVLLSGLMGAVVPMTLHKACGVWFSGKRLGLANGVVAAGMAFGLMTGSMVSATVLSPWLGGWRYVLFFYGGVAVVMMVPWVLTRAAPSEGAPSTNDGSTVSMRQALSHMVRLRNVWLLGAAILGVGGCVQGTLGYLPLYLREIGWPAAHADAALASFHAISLVSVFPLALLSDRLGSRKTLLVVATLMIGAGVGLLAVADGALVWVAVLLAGAVRDGYMAIFVTTVTEQDGVGAAYAGTALGLTSTLSRVGSLLAPPLGNSLASRDLRLPFVLWAAMALAGFAALYLIKEK
jgi:MFS family permease